MTSQLHRINPSAADGFSQAAEAYREGRPGYPDDVGRWLRDDLGLSKRSAALDLGAGTGKFTPWLIKTGADVSAVEPVDAMRAELAHALPAVRAMSGTAENIPLEDETLDAVVCAQSFHWFATPSALSEIRRVLRPGGRLGLVWNVRDERVSWVAALSEIMRPYEGDTPRFHEGRWRRLFPADGFGPLSERRCDHAHRGPSDKVILQRVLSVSFIAALPADERDKVARQVLGVIADTPDLAGSGEVTFPYSTIAVYCSKV